MPSDMNICTRWLRFVPTARIIPISTFRSAASITKMRKISSMPAAIENSPSTTKNVVKKLDALARRARRVLLRLVGAATACPRAIALSSLVTSSVRCEAVAHAAVVGDGDEVDLVRAPEQFLRARRSASAKPNVAPRREPVSTRSFTIVLHREVVRLRRATNSVSVSPGCDVQLVRRGLAGVDLAGGEIGRRETARRPASARSSSKPRACRRAGPTSSDERLGLALRLVAARRPAPRTTPIAPSTPSIVAELRRRSRPPARSGSAAAEMSRRERRRSSNGSSSSLPLVRRIVRAATISSMLCSRSYVLFVML